jgi:hypothetical protein
MDQTSCFGSRESEGETFSGFFLYIYLAVLERFFGLGMLERRVS